VVQIPGFEQISLLHSSAKSHIYRAIETSTRERVILKTSASSLPSQSEVERLRHELGLLNGLQGTAAPKPKGSFGWGSRLVLVFPDFEALSLKELAQGRPLELDPFFPLSLAILDCLKSVHSQGLLFRDLKPSNLIFAPKSGQVYLIDFGSALLASLVPTLVDPEAGLEGSLAYIAPEQTGRMEQAIDKRSDFYSLGATFYDLLCGRPPFVAQDDLELIHAHLALKPQLLETYNPQVPPGLGQVVLKLLCKNPSDRYQSLFGLEWDLKTCQRLFLETGEVPPFQLGAKDQGERLLIPDRLYGRERQTKVLESAYELALASGTHLILVQGVSGMGKSSLVSVLQKPLSKDGGFWAVGKFDQLKRNLPYFGFTQALDQLVLGLLTKEPEVLEAWTQKIKACLGINGALLLDLIPSLGKLLGPQGKAPELGAMEAQNRFVTLFESFVGLFAQPEHPLVIFLDDLQWADQSSLELLKSLLTAEDPKALLLIGAFRDNEVGPDHPLTTGLIQNPKYQIKLDNLTLLPLGADAIAQLLADSLAADRSGLLPLAEEVEKKTGGNPFFIREFLFWLCAQGLLSFDPRKAAWTFDLSQIRAARATQNVGDLLGLRINQLNAQNQEILSLGSLFGDRFPFAGLLRVWGGKASHLAQGLLELGHEGLLLLSPKTETLLGEWAIYEGQERRTPLLLPFSHDRVQQAAYDKIPPEHRPVLHLKTARLLQEEQNLGEGEDQLFDLLHHFNLGIEASEDPKEREALGLLNLEAALKARAATAFSTALACLEQAHKILGLDFWSRNPKREIDLLLLKAECSMLLSDFAGADLAVSEVLVRTGDKAQMAEAYSYRLLNQIQQNSLHQALLTGIAGLAPLGMRVSPKVTLLHLLPELLKVKKNLAGRKVASLVDLKKIDDPVVQLQMKLLVDLTLVAYFEGDDNLLAFCVLKMVNLSLKHGHVPASAYAYAAYAAVLSGALGDLGLGQEFGQLALAVNRRFEDFQFRAKVQFLSLVFVRTWAGDGRKFLEEMQKVYEIGLASGDMVYAAFACINLVSIPFETGAPVAEVLSRFESYHPFVQRVGDKTSIEIHRLAEYWSLELLEPKLLNNPLAKTPLDLNTPMLFHLDQIYRIKTLSLMDASEELLPVVLEALRLFFRKNLNQAANVVRNLVLYGGLVLVAQLPRSSGWQRLQIRYWLKKCLHQSKRWADFGPQAGLSNHLILVAAYQRLRHKSKAATGFEKALAQAVKEERLDYQVTACLLAGHHYEATGQKEAALALYGRAHYGLTRLGATGAAQHLQEKHQLELQTGLSGPLDHEATHSATGSSSGQRSLDLLSVMKSAQVFSSELRLEQLLGRMIDLFIENAGAQSGAFVVVKGGKLWVEAQKDVSGQSSVLGSLPLEQAAGVCSSLIRYVFRTGEDLVLEDACLDPRFLGEEEVQNRKVRSVLCTRIQGQGRLLGLLYLENNLAPKVFHQARLEVLGLLSFQVSVSLENAQLYHSLEQRVEERTRAVRELLDNTDQGFFSFDATQKVHPEYSHACLELLGGSPEGKDVVELLFPKEQEEEAREMIEFCFDQTVEFDMAKRLLPAQGKMGEKILKLDYFWIEERGGNPARIMAEATDVTIAKGLEEILAKTEAKKKFISKVAVSRERFIEFIQDLNRILGQIDLALSPAGGKAGRIELLRGFHTIKGNAANFALNQMVELAHQLENQLGAQTGDWVEPFQIPVLQEGVQGLRLELEGYLKELQGIIAPEEWQKQTSPIYKVPEDKLLALEALCDHAAWKDQIACLRHRPLAVLFNSLQTEAERLAEKLEKEITVTRQGAEIEVDWSALAPVAGALVHLIRNALDHGVESPQDRLEAGKSREGHLRFEAWVEGQRLQLRFSDDGQGIDPVALQESLLAKGMVSAEQAGTLDPKELLAFVFRPGFSTKTTVTDLSGRGVGLDALKAEVETLGGGVKVESQKGQGTTFTLSLPPQGPTGSRLFSPPAAKTS